MTFRRKKIDGEGELDGQWQIKTIRRKLMDTGGQTRRLESETGPCVHAKFYM